ncbi:MAG: tryptophan synthase subunit alpha, partial [Proteobacteria bacterium]
RSATDGASETAVKRLKSHCDLPIAVGFGIRTPDQVAAVGRVADAAVVGSAIVNLIAENLDDEGRPDADLPSRVLAFVKTLARGLEDD